MIKAVTQACMPFRTAITVTFAANAAYQLEINPKITKGGMIEQIALMKTPGHPATFFPAKTLRLMAMAPGEDCATAAISINSSLENSRFFST